MSRTKVFLIRAKRKEPCMLPLSHDKAFPSPRGLPEDVSEALSATVREASYTQTAHVMAVRHHWDAVQKREIAQKYRSCTVNFATRFQVRMPPEITYRCASVLTTTRARARRIRDRARRVPPVLGKSKGTEPDTNMLERLRRSRT